MSSLKAKTLARLREQMRRLEKPGIADRPVLEFGDPVLDDELPGGGLASGCLHEITAAPDDGAAYGLAAWLLGRVMGKDGVALWCRQQRRQAASGPGLYGSGPYGPGLAGFGIATERLLFARTSSPVDMLWAMEEALRSGRFAAVLGEGTADLTATRRLQLAAEAGGTMAVLLSFPSRTSRPRLSAATTRWRVASLPAERPGISSWHVELERCRGGRCRAWALEWNHETLRLDIAPLLGDRALAAL